MPERFFYALNVRENEMKKIQAVLFDHDGTLVHSEPTHLAMWRKAVEPYGGYITDEEYWQLLLGVPAEENAEILIELRGLSTEVSVLVAEKLRHTREYLLAGCFPEVSGASDVLKRLYGRVAMGLVSGSQRFCINATLKGHRWEHYFACIVTGEDVARNKPYPDSYLRAVALMDGNAESCVAIEDTQTGVLAAVAAGVPVIAIRNEYSLDHDFSKAIVEVSSLDEAYLFISERI